MRQIGGIAAGILIVFALVAIYVTGMKQAGRSLGDRFLENANAGSPLDAINRVDASDALLQTVHDICKSKSKIAELTPLQKDATDGYMQIYSGEYQLLQAGAYVECLASTQPQRFCLKSHKAHLAEALRQYFKLMGQMRAEWALQMNGPGSEVAAARDAPYTHARRLALDLPSARTSPTMLAELRNLATKGYVSAGDFGSFAGLGIPRDLSEAFEDVRVKRAACG